MQVRVQYMQNGNYVGAPVPEALISEWITRWNTMPDVDTEAMSEAKINRDGERAFHITVFTPKETREMRKNGVAVDDEWCEFRVTGIGHVEDCGKEAFYGVVESEDIQTIREAHGYGRKDIHITFGFSGGDVHTKSKGEETIIIDSFR